MKILLTVLFALLAAGPVRLHVSPEGRLKVEDESEIGVSAYAPGWRPCQTMVDWKNAGGPVCIMDRDRRIFEQTSVWKQSKRGQLSGEITLKCLQDVDMQCLAMAFKNSFAGVEGRSWFADSKERVLPTEQDKSAFGSGTASELRLPVKGGRTLVARFEVPVRYSSQDGRKWGNYWNVRVGEIQSSRSFKSGDVVKFRVTLSSPDKLEFQDFRNCEISESKEWRRIEYHKDIVPGSALDFSSQGLQDAPAGKYGWLKAVGGSFEFEDSPGVAQRFYGVNLCFTANYPSHEMADKLVDRLMRLGYNTLRVHHHDNAWRNADNQDRLDYLLAAAFRKGIYVTTDLYVSREVSWREIGIDRDGRMEKAVYKTLVLCYEPAYENWCRFSREFLEHVNPYTGRAYMDEPGMPFISLINEGKLSMHFADKAGDERILAAWKEFGGEGNFSTKNPVLEDFDLWLETRFTERATAFLRSLGCKALLTNDNNGGRHAEGDARTLNYDYVDNHFYIDHPKFLVKRWQLPSFCQNANPVFSGGPSMFRKGYAKDATKPYTITEWNFSGPGRYRGVGGIITGAMASIQDWDGLWRFSYAHNSANLEEADGQRMTYFDMSVDPLSQASDRASVCLFLRRDASGEGDIVMDRETGVMKLVTPRTCGVFSTGGREVAGVLDAEIMTCPATVWVSSLDGADLHSSGRMLLTHVTDVQGDGTVYAGCDRQVLLKWGKGQLVEVGSAKIRLTLDSPSDYVVYELDTAGTRMRALKSSVSGSALVFTVSTDGPSGGRLNYEITKKQ